MLEFYRQDMIRILETLYQSSRVISRARTSWGPQIFSHRRQRRLRIP